MKMKSDKLFLIPLLALLFSQASAQDIHFSQYYLSPLSLNPANCGNYSGDFRGMLNYRSQWRQIDKTYNTISAGGDYNFYPMNQKVSGGLYFINDKSGGNLVMNKIFASVVVAKKIGGFDLHFGLQPGVVIKSWDVNSNSYPDQLNWGTGYFDKSLPNNEATAMPRSTYFDLNSGLIVSKRFNKIEVELGTAFFHMTSPKESLLSTANKLTPRQIYHGELRYFLNDKITLKPYFMVDATTKASDLIMGGNVDYLLSRTPFFRNSVYAGFMWRDGFKRISDAAIFTVGLNYLNYTVGISYDVNISQLHTATSYRGAIEFALIYTGKNTRLIKKEIPCERY